MKKTLLIAAAALAAGIISTQAQVYSQNVVGYYNLTLPATYSLVSVQFQVGSSNGASEVFPSIPDGTAMIQWNASGSTFVYNYYDTGAGSTPPAQSWYMSDYATPTNQPVLKVGQSVFLLPPTAVTNAVVGTVPSAATNNLIAGYNMIASALPAGGAITNTLFNFNSFPDGTALLRWNGVGYVYNYYDTGGNTTIPGDSWYMSDYATPTNAPVLSVGSGSFLVPPSGYSYTQSYTNN